jgi:hypothetical protein
MQRALEKSMQTIQKTQKCRNKSCKKEVTYDGPVAGVNEYINRGKKKVQPQSGYTAAEPSYSQSCLSAPQQRLALPAPPQTEGQLDMQHLQQLSQ